MSIVLVIITLVTAAGMKLGASAIESAKRANTNNKLDEIEKALLAFRMVSNRLPCPADVTIVNGAANFGVEAANPGTCTGGQFYV